MNSLVVFLSVVALAAAKPSHLIDSGVVAYSTPIVATGAAAVSHQARFDIKSSPAIVETAVYAPIVSRAVIAKPTLLAAPAIVAPAAVSSQSRIDIKTTPAITNTVVASAPLAYNAPIATAPVSPALVNTEFIAPAITTGAVGPVILKTLAPAISTPTVIKSAGFVPGAIDAAAVSLGVPEVAHTHATTIETSAHVLKKRSAPFTATAPILTYASSPLVSTYGVSPLTYTTPIKIASPFISQTYNLHAW